MEARDERPENADTSAGRARLVRGLIAGVVLALLAYALLAAWADFRGLRAAFARFDLRLVPVALALSSLNYVVRYARFELYLRALGIRVPRARAFTISLAGLAFTVSPGKMGETFKSWLLKREARVPIATSAPIVVAERFTDLCACLVLITLGGLSATAGYEWVFWTTLALCLALVVAASWHGLQEFVLRALERTRLGSRGAPRLRAALASTRTLLAPRALLVPTCLATLGWALECLAFWLVADSLVPGSVSLAFAASSFALASVAGALAILFPGGLGVTEASLSWMLARRYVEAGSAAEPARASALTATLVIRFCTLWFAVLVGCVAMWHFNRSARRAAPS